MIPRQQSAGTAGIIAGISLAILFLLYITSGATPETLADPAKALAFIGQNAGRLRAIAVFDVIALAFAILFIAGLAGKLRDKTPTRATGVLYFAILGAAGYGVDALSTWLAWPALAQYAATDQVASAHAWLAVHALNNVFLSFGSLFIGLSTLLAGWAITATGGMSSALGWYGVVTGAVGVLNAVAPAVTVLFLGAIVLPVIWLLWAGNALRTGM